jgi:hypothetical protein
MKQGSGQGNVFKFLKNLDAAANGKEYFKKTHGALLG